MDGSTKIKKAKHTMMMYVFNDDDIYMWIFVARNKTDAFERLLNYFKAQMIEDPTMKFFYNSHFEKWSRSEPNNEKEYPRNCTVSEYPITQIVEIT